MTSTTAGAGATLVIDAFGAVDALPRRRTASESGSDDGRSRRTRPRSADRPPTGRSTTVDLAGCDLALQEALASATAGGERDASRSLLKVAKTIWLEPKWLEPI